jgi:hypothetical protein
MLNNTSASNSIDILKLLKTWVPRLALAAAVFFVLYHQIDGLKLFYNHSRSVINFPYPIDYGEGPLLDQVARLASFQNIYQNDISKPPFTITNYPPFIPWYRCHFTGFLGQNYGMAESYHC